MEEIEDLKKENQEIKKVLASLVSCVVTIADKTSHYPIILEAQKVVDCCNATTLFNDQDL